MKWPQIVGYRLIDKDSKILVNPFHKLICLLYDPPCRSNKLTTSKNSRYGSSETNNVQRVKEVDPTNIGRSPYDPQYANNVQGVMQGRPNDCWETIFKE